MWKGVEVVEGERYRVGLKSSSDGQRTTALVRDGDDETEFDFVTEIVEDFEALQNRNLRKILDATPLNDGSNVWLDAHNIWFTSAEMDQLEESDHDFSAVDWHRGIPPQLAPK
ncbi:MAG: hypothetical protein ACSHYF_09115 [Verrucomicrobiaceae bacterium]